MPKGKATTERQHRTRRRGDAGRQVAGDVRERETCTPGSNFGTACLVADATLQIAVIYRAGRKHGLTVLLLILRYPARIEVFG